MDTFAICEFLPEKNQISGKKKNQKSHPRGRFLVLTVLNTN